MKDSSKKPRLRLQQIIQLVIQSVVSIGLLLWLAQLVDWREIIRTFSTAIPLLILVTSVLFYCNLFLSCYKWSLLLKVEGFSLPFSRLARWYLIGTFANNFLPTDIGGDLGRGIYASRATGKPLAIARSILVERLTGLLILLLLAWIGLIVILGQWLVAVILLCIGLGMLVVAWKAPRIISKYLPSRIKAKLAQIPVLIRHYREHSKTLLSVFAISIVFQLLSGCGAWLNMRAVHAELPLVPVILVAALAGVLGILPIAINGWGVRESAFVTLLADLGASSSAILAGALFGRALMLVLSLAGAVALVFERNTQSPTEHTAEP